MWWQQGLPEEGGRTTIMHGSGGKQTTLLPAPWSARTRVHEYGGQSFLPVPRAACSRASRPGRPRVTRSCSPTSRDQRLYLAGPGVAEGREQPRPITPDPLEVQGGSGPLASAGLRYADFTLSHDKREVWCVQERHDGRQGQPRRSWPSRWTARPPAAPDEIRTLVTGTDFFAFPTPVARRRSGWPGSAGTTRTCRGTAPSCGSRRSQNGDARQGPPAQGQPARVGAGPAVAGQRAACTWPPTGRAGGTSTSSG